MKVVAFADTPPQAWDSCCEASAQAWLYHRADWVDIETRFFGVVNHSFSLVREGQVLAVQPLYAADIGLARFTERLVHSGLHRHTGLACRDGLLAQDVAAARAAAMARILEVAAAERADRIQLNVQNLAPLSLTAAREEIPFWVLDHDFQLGLRFGPMGINPAPGQSTCAADQVVDLAPSEDELRAALEATCRRAVRKAEDSGLACEAVDPATPTAVAEYYSLAERSASRTGESLAPQKYYQHLATVLGPQGRLALLFARHGDRTVAGLLLAVDKGMATYAGGVSDPEMLRLRPNDFIHWSAIRWARSRGLRGYRLGPVFPELPTDWPVCRVARFKRKFGGRSYTVIQGSRFLSPERYQEAA